MITWLPDLATIYTEDGAQSFAGAQGGRGDVRCALEMEGDLLRVTLCAQDTPARLIRLRWHFAGEKGATTRRASTATRGSARAARWNGAASFRSAACPGSVW